MCCTVRSSIPPDHNPMDHRFRIDESRRKWYPVPLSHWSPCQPFHGSVWHHGYAVRPPESLPYWRSSSFCQSSDVYALSKCIWVLTKVGHAIILLASMTFVPSEAVMFSEISLYFPFSSIKISAMVPVPFIFAFLISSRKCRSAVIRKHDCDRQSRSGNYGIF